MDLYKVYKAFKNKHLPLHLLKVLKCDDILKFYKELCLTLGWSSQYPLQSLLTGYQCNCNDEHTSYGETGVPVPPFGCTFSSGKRITM